MPLLRFALIACLVGLFAPACTQDEDEACQVNKDCADGLVCSIGRSDLRGTCVPPGEDMEVDESDAAIGEDTVDADVSVRDGAADDDAG